MKTIGCYGCYINLNCGGEGGYKDNGLSNNFDEEVRTSPLNDGTDAERLDQGIRANIAGAY